ncbi:hypothetical protein U2A4042310001 [Corynebacterium striatum]|nr:hypothetical protein U2A4042310001 [Corynebacterium striatum]
MSALLFLARPFDRGGRKRPQLWRWGRRLRLCGTQLLICKHGFPYTKIGGQEPKILVPDHLKQRAGALDQHVPNLVSALLTSTHPHPHPVPAARPPCGCRGRAGARVRCRGSYQCHGQVRPEAAGAGWRNSPRRETLARQAEGTRPDHSWCIG